MRHRLHQISLLCCLAVPSAMLAMWILALINYFSQPLVGDSAESRDKTTSEPERTA